jgi:hypothetical protein
MYSHTAPKPTMQPYPASALPLPARATQDFAEGHIKGAVQWESERFTDDAQVDQLIQEHLLGKSQVSAAQQDGQHLLLGWRGRVVP